MKNILIIATLLGISGATYAQKTPDTSSFFLGDKTEIIVIQHENVPENDDVLSKQQEKKEERKDKLKGVGMNGILLGYGGLMAANNSFKLNDTYEDYQLGSFSSWMQLNIINHELGIVKDKLILATCVGVEFNTYKFAKEHAIMADTNQLVFVNYPPDGQLKRNNFVVSYFNASTMLEAVVRKKVHVGVGASIGVNADNRIRSKFITKDGAKVKATNVDNYNVNPFKANLMAKVGYNKFNIFATYAPESFGQMGELFKRSSGAQAVHPFSIGIMLIGWGDSDSDSDEKSQTCML